ncbi:hypothetical protein AB0H83_40285 [Dactylosporangium sp. NPDC050688]|uniref:hypothetical protein n=1 Tax=Dactylosporangium sp. NPDC050688 TaxID=3157217 RepID=UPI0033EDEF02
MIVAVALVRPNHFVGPENLRRNLRDPKHLKFVGACVPLHSSLIPRPGAGLVNSGWTPGISGNVFSIEVVIEKGASDLPGAVDPAWWVTGTWDGRPIGVFLAKRDVATIFRFVHARGISYNAIGALVGLSANRVAEIAKDVRQVTAYEVLERVAVGLQIPRPAMGVGLLESESLSALNRHSDNVDGRSVGHIAADHGPTADLDMLAGIRAGLDEALASSTVSPRQMELIEESVAEHVQAYPASAPSLMLTRLAGECAEVQALSRRRQPAMLQARLSGAAALLATMCADALMRLGEIRQAKLWYRTALVASDDSAEPRLRVLVRAQAAMLPYYFGDPRRTVSLADAALALSEAASPSSALAAAARARALARLGAVDAARAAIGEARRSFDEVGDADSDEAFRFPAKRLLFYLSGATTWIGDTAAAYGVQEAALQLYQASPVKTLIDPALIRLDQAMCLASDRRTAEAAAEAQKAVDELPRLQRTELVLARAADVVEAVPRSKRGPEVVALSHYIAACRSQTRTLAGGTVSPDP